MTTRPSVAGSCAAILTAPEAKSRGLYRPEHVEHLLNHPDELTTLRYNQLWELGILELWLQANEMN